MSTEYSTSSRACWLAGSTPSLSQQYSQGGSGNFNDKEPRAGGCHTDILVLASLIPSLPTHTHTLGFWNGTSVMSRVLQTLLSKYEHYCIPNPVLSPEFIFPVEPLWPISKTESPDTVTLYFVLPHIWPGTQAQARLQRSSTWVLPLSFAPLCCSSTAQGYFSPGFNWSCFSELQIYPSSQLLFSMAVKLQAAHGKVKET